MVLDCSANWSIPEGRNRKAKQAYDEEGESRRCCKFSESLRGDSREGLREVFQTDEPGQPKSLGTDAFTAS